MKLRVILSLAVAVVLCAGFAVAGELKSGPEPGADVGAFIVTKCAGAENDDVAVGEELCYRCRMGERPVVMVFARKADKDLAKLVKELDKAVAKHEDAKLASFVNLIGKDREALSKEAKSFIEHSKAKNIAVVVPIDQEDTEKQFKLNPEAKLTIVAFNKGTVAATHAIGEELKPEEIAQVVKDSEKMLR